MEDALAKIRPHRASKLAHQKAPAMLLHALESTFEEQKAEKSSTAYFAALLTTLDGTLQDNDRGLDEGDRLPAELYLLALVAPFVAASIIRAQIDTVLSLTAPLFPSLIPYAPPLRSQLTLYHTILVSLDRPQLEIQGIRQAFATILQLCVDSRPKVRKRAADLVKDVLAIPPPPLLQHPYADRVAVWVKSSLTQVQTGVLARSKAQGKGSDASTADVAIHLLAFLRPLVFNLPSTTLPDIINLMLSLPRLGNSYLTQSTYSTLSDFFTVAAESEESTVIAQMPNVLRAILSSPPPKGDRLISSAWLQVLGKAMRAYSAIDSAACATELSKVWSTVWVFLESTDTPTRRSAAQSLDTLAKCITSSLITEAAKEGLKDDPKSTLGEIILQSTKSLDSLAYARSIPEVLEVISSIIANLQLRPLPSGPTVVDLLVPTIRKIGQLRVSSGFEYKEAADSTLATAMRIFGPEHVLRVLPLNLDPTDRQDGKEPRAFLLPLLVHPHPSPLAHFVSYFVPLSERMFDLQQKSAKEGRAAEAKVWSVLIAQIWSGFAGYCWETVDLRESMTPAFSQVVSKILYDHPELRPSVLKALKVMVESNVAIASSNASEPRSPVGANNLSPEEATLNVAFLRTHAESWLSVLFNIFGSMDMDARGMVGNVISTWLAIADGEAVTQAYHKVVDIFKRNLNENAMAPSDASKGQSSVTATMQDLLILLLPHLAAVDATALFQVCLSPEVLGNKDNGIQKRGYRILAILAGACKVGIDVEPVLQKLDEASDSLAPAAKKDRFALLSLVVKLIPETALHIIPSLIPEAVLGTKEPSEKARSAAFDLIVAMGQKMGRGGVVKKDMIEGMMDDDTPEATASVGEYMTMIAGGLAGASPHMISATITAMSRLVFEFKDDISPQMHNEIYTTLLVFLSSPNREIVKSTLGFIKLATHTLPIELLRPHLKDTVLALLGWSHDHKNHFKTKVRHIFERMIRRFGWDDVYACAGEEESAKVLVNIRKRKERAKRKKTRAEDEADSVSAPGKPATGDAFEDVLYGSESELDDSEDEQHDPHPRRKGFDQGARLRVDDDEPMDLLQGASSRIITARHRRSKPGGDEFKVDEDTGKMIIDDANDGESDNAQTADDIAGTAYREAITSVDGFTRGAGGRVKFNKDTKKRRREAGEIDEDVDMMDIDGAFPKRRGNKRRTEVKLGHEFKAKKAGGDVKKGGTDPYAYLPLSQAAKKSGRGGHGRIGIAGRK